MKQKCYNCNTIDDFNIIKKGTMLDSFAVDGGLLKNAVDVFCGPGFEKRWTFYQYFILQCNVCDQHYIKFNRKIDDIKMLK